MNDNIKDNAAKILADLGFASGRGWVEVWALDDWNETGHKNPHDYSWEMIFDGKKVGTAIIPVSDDTTYAVDFTCAHCGRKLYMWEQRTGKIFEWQAE